MLTRVFEPFVQVNRHGAGTHDGLGIGARNRPKRAARSRRHGYAQRATANIKAAASH